MAKVCVEQSRATVSLCGHPDVDTPQARRKQLTGAELNRLGRGTVGDFATDRIRQ